MSIWNLILINEHLILNYSFYTGNFIFYTNIKIDTYPILSDPSYNRSWCGGCSECWSGLPTRWRYSFFRQTVYNGPHSHSNLILIHQQHQKLCWYRSCVLGRDFVGRLVYKVLNFLKYLNFKINLTLYQKHHSV